MKTILHKYILSSIPLIFFFIGSLAQNNITVKDIPNPKSGGRGYVSDKDNYLSANEVSQLNRLLADLEDSLTVQIAVVMVKSIGEQVPKDFAYTLFNEWGIGYKGTDNGLLILSVMDQRRTEFETGYGLEGVLPDLLCYKIGMQELVPYFREGKYGQGLIATVNRFREVLENPDAAAEVRADRSRPTYSAPLGVPFGLWIYFAIGLIVSLAILSRIIGIIRGREDAYDKYISLSKNSAMVLIFIFPLPYLFIYLFLQNRLKYFREMPRFSKANGKPMQKLDEKADDEFLSEGQVTEEEIGSVDYDVWLTEDEDDLLILRYPKRFSRYSKCPKCNFVTYSKVKSFVIAPATTYSTGRRKVIHQCKNCYYKKETIQIIPKIQRSKSSGGGGFSGGGGSGSWGGGSSGGGGAGVSW